MSRKLIKSGAVVSFMTLLSRVMGLIRDVVIAQLMGAGVGADVFILANKVPNFLRRLFAEGAFSQAFVPVLAEYKEKKPKQTIALIQATAGALGVLVTGVTLVGVLCSPVVAALFANGWFVAYLNDSADGAKFEMASLLLKLTFPYLWFVSFVAFAGSILNMLDKFAVSAFTPIFLNISMISFAIWVCPQMAQPEIGLALSVFVGGLLQFGFQLPFLKRAGFLVKPTWQWQHPGVKKIRKLMLPALFGVSVSQINLLLDTIIASYLVTGSISWLYYSDRLLEFPLGLFGIAIATVILPALSKKHAKVATKGYRETMDWGVRSVVFLGLPAMLGLMLLAKPTLMVLFMRGAFTAADVDHATLSLLAYMIGLLNFMLIKVFATGYYSRQDTKTPVRYGIIAMAVNMVLNLIFASFLGYVGLALATSVSAGVNMLLLYRGLMQSKVYEFTPKTWQFLGKVVLASAVMVAVILALSPTEGQWFAMTTMTRVWHLTGLIFIGASAYLLIVFGCRGHKDLLPQKLPAKKAKKV